MKTINYRTDPAIIAQTIGREKITRNPPKFDEDKKHLIDFRNPGVKWLTSLTKYERGATRY